MAGAHAQALSGLVDFISVFSVYVGGEWVRGEHLVLAAPLDVCRKSGSLYEPEVYCSRLLQFCEGVLVWCAGVRLIMLSWYLSEAVETASSLSCTLAQFVRLFSLIFLSLPVTHLFPTSDELAYKTKLARRSLIYSLLIDSGKVCELGKEALTFNLMPFRRFSFLSCISMAFGRHELFFFVLDPHLVSA